MLKVVSKETCHQIQMKLNWPTSASEFRSTKTGQIVKSRPVQIFEWVCPKGACHLGIVQKDKNVKTKKQSYRPNSNLRCIIYKYNYNSQTLSVRCYNAKKTLKLIIINNNVTDFHRDHF